MWSIPGFNTWTLVISIVLFINDLPNACNMKTTLFADNSNFQMADKCLISYNRVVQLLHSRGPLFKIIRVCGPQSAKNSYFRSKIRVFSKKKKKGLHLESVCKIPIFVPKSGVL